MYNLSHFKADRPEEVLSFMKAHPFVLLCGATLTGIPAATQVPVMFEERDGRLFLLAHIMRRQDHSLTFEENPNVLVIFTGAHSYVSASWYTDPKVASTWNYRAVHVRGKLTFHDNEDFLHGLLTRLTHQYESPDSPALVEKMDAGYVKKTMAAIIGFEIEVQSVDHVFKLSQNHKKETYASIVSHLDALGGESAQVARDMKDRESR